MKKDLVKPEAVEQFLFGLIVFGISMFFLILAKGFGIEISNFIILVAVLTFVVLLFLIYLDGRNK